MAGPPGKGDSDMKIHLASVFVDDQDKALHFYTTILGFVAKSDIPMGSARWITVASPEDPDGAQLVLEIGRGVRAIEHVVRAELDDSRSGLRCCRRNPSRFDFTRLVAGG